MPSPLYHTHQGRIENATTSSYSAVKGVDSPKPLKKSQIANYRFSKTAK